jgi:hypothetical protein
MAVLAACLEAGAKAAAEARREAAMAIFMVEVAGRFNADKESGMGCRRFELQGSSVSGLMTGARDSLLVLGASHDEYR